MLDTVKDYLEPKTFSIRAYVCSIIQLLCGLAFIGIVIALRVGETAKFNCVVDPKSAASYKTDVERRCNSKYQHKYNSPLPFYGFVSLCFWFPIIIGVIYSLAVRSRVEEINTVSTDESQTNPAAEDQQQNRRSCHVFYSYFFHLVIRLVFGLLFSVLQYVVFFPNSFDFKFICNLPTSEVTSKITKNSSASRQLNSTSIICENSTALEKKLWAGIVCALNTIFAVIIFVEVIYLCLRFPRNLKFYSGVGRIYDTEFVTVYFSRKEYRRVGTELTKFECIDLYRERVLKESRTLDITYGPKTGLDIGLDELFIDVVIHTEHTEDTERARAPNVNRHEIFDVYREVPLCSLQLELKHLFYWERPRKILVVGRPGIGKTVLTRKIMRDWANKIYRVYSGMIAFYFKFRWFNLPEWKNLTLKKFLCFGTGLSDEKFEGIFRDIIKNPKKALLIFDGLDEFDGKFEDYRDHLPHQNNPDVGMPGISLFIKLIFDHFLPGATVLVTTRPTANEFYSNFRVRNVEIIGFTEEKTKDYVRKFCENHDRRDLEQKIWNHIMSSSDLLNLCYIPVNCFIISTVLFGCLRDASDETVVLPTTLAELYQAAIEHLDEYHYRKRDELSSKEAIKKLRLLAYNGIVNGQLVFNKELVDEVMRRSGLLNNLSNPIFPIQTQFCFIHLTIQEFLAAEHVTETQSPEEIKNFISSNIKDGKWHLVLRFIAGILGQKRKKFKKEYQRYKDCALAFTEIFNVDCDGKLDLCRNYSSMLVMKCLWEVGDESVVKEACEGTAMNDVVSLTNRKISDRKPKLELSPSDWAAVCFVCKHMKNLTNMDILFSPMSLIEECYVEFNKLLQQRCIKELNMNMSTVFGQSEVKNTIPSGPVFKALLESKCTLNHRHNMLTNLFLRRFFITHESLSILLDFFRHRRATCLEKLSLHKSYLSPSKITKICEVLDIEHCPELTRLDLSDYKIPDEGVRVLCTALIKCHQLKLTELHLKRCSLTAQCIPSLCELFKDEHCKLTVFNVGCNNIGDEVVRMLCEDVLTKEHHKLVKLDVCYCSLTDQCIPWLRKALLDKHCVLETLSLYGNMFTTKGKESLLELQTHEDCRAKGLEVNLVESWSHMYLNYL